MRIQKIKNTSFFNIKHRSTIKPKILFKGDSFEKPENKKLTFVQKRTILSRLKGIEIASRYKAIFLPDNEFKRFVDFYENHEKDSGLAIQYSRLGERQDRLYKYLREKSVTPKYALKATGYTNAQLDRYAKIFGEFNPEYMMDKAVCLDDKKYERLISLLNENNGFVSSFDIAVLEDNEYEKAIELKNKGFNIIFADNVVKDKGVFEVLNQAIEDGIDMKILNVAFKRTTEFSEIKKNAKVKNLEEFITSVALKNVSDSILDYFKENIKKAKGADFTVLNNNGKVSTHVIDKSDGKIQCEYSYDKKGKIKDVTYLTSRKNYPLELKFSFENELLKQAVYKRNELEIYLDVNSPEFLSIFDTKYGTESMVDVLLRIESARNLLDEDYESLNALVFGEKNEQMLKAVDDFEAEFPKVKLFVDNKVDTKYIQRLRDVLKTQPKHEIPKKIFITSFMPYNTSGEFGHTNKIAVLPVEDMEFFDVSVLHEIQHMKDYVSGLKLGQSRAGNALVYGKEIFSDIHGQILKGKIMLLDGKLVISDSDLKNLITQQVSDYGTTNCAEFIAEFGAMMRKGMIGAKQENGEIKYSINKVHKDARLNDCIIKKDEFAKLLKLYLLLGGTPEFNDNFVESNEVITVSQKEAMRADLDNFGKRTF